MCCGGAGEKQVCYLVSALLMTSAGLSSLTVTLEWPANKFSCNDLVK